MFRFRSITENESYNNAIDQDIDAEGAVPSGYLQKLNPPDFSEVHRSQYRKGTDFKQDIVEYTGNKCFIPLKEYRFITFNW